MRVVKPNSRYLDLQHAYNQLLTGWYAVLLLAADSNAYINSKATILGTAINQDGRSSGLTAPNGPSQTTLLLEVISMSRIESSSLSFMAVHGTGTPLGDPIEVSALGGALEQSQCLQARVVTMGSVKACYGHTEGAAGMTGNLKI